MTQAREHESGASDEPLPPFDTEAEGAVLSAVMLDPTAIAKVIDFLEPRMFYSEAHRWIFEAAIDLLAQKEPIDVTTVQSWLRTRADAKGKNRLVQVGGVGYLAEIIDAAPFVSNVRKYGMAIHDTWRRREVIRVSQRVAATGYIHVPDVQAWCDDAVRSIGRLAILSPVRPVEGNADALKRMLAEVFDMPEKGKETGSVVSGFPIGLHGLDRILGGLHKGSKTTIVGGTGAGKTVLGMQVATALAKRGVGVLSFSTEWKRQRLLLRAACAESGVSMNKIKRNGLTAADRFELIEASTRITALPWFIDETPKITVEDICVTARAHAERVRYIDRVPLACVVVDHVHRVEPSPHTRDRERTEQLTHITKRLKQLAQDLDLVVLELAQGKPVPQGQKPPKPHKSNCTADSNKIAWESDDVIVLVVDDAPTEENPRGEVTAHVVKQRDGAEGEVPLVLHADTYTFVDPNTPATYSNPSRQYIDPIPEPPPGRFDDDGDSNPLTEGLL